jgi:hypothetical protein
MSSENALEQNIRTISLGKGIMRSGTGILIFSSTYHFFDCNNIIMFCFRRRKRYDIVYTRWDATLEIRESQAHFTYVFVNHKHTKSSGNALEQNIRTISLGKGIMRSGTVILIFSNTYHFLSVIIMFCFRRRKRYDTAKSQKRSEQNTKYYRHD